VEQSSALGFVLFISALRTMSFSFESCRSSGDAEHCDPGGGVCQLFCSGSIPTKLEAKPARGGSACLMGRRYLRLFVQAGLWHSRDVCL